LITQANGRTIILIVFGFWYLSFIVAADLLRLDMVKFNVRQYDISFQSFKVFFYPQYIKLLCSFARNGAKNPQI